jgi:hypothetical protein
LVNLRDNLGVTEAPPEEKLPDRREHAVYMSKLIKKRTAVALSSDRHMQGKWNCCGESGTFVSFSKCQKCFSPMIASAQVEHDDRHDARCPIRYSMH